MADKKLNTEGVDLSVFKTKKLNTEGIDLSVFDNAKNTEPDLSNPVKTENVQTGQTKPDIQANKGLVSTPNQEFLSQDEFERQNWFSPKVNDELSNQSPYKQPIQDNPDYMGVFNNKEDIKTINERGVSVSTFDEIKKSAAQAEYPIEYMAEANFVKKRIEKLKKYYPEANNEINAIPIDKISPQNIDEITKAVDNVESQYDKSFVSGVFSPVEVKSKYKTDIENDKSYLDAVRMLTEDSSKLLIATKDIAPSDKWGALKGTISASNNIARGARIGLKDYAEGYIDLQRNIKGNKAVTDVLNKIDSEEPLTSDERLLIKSIYDNAKLHESLDDNIKTSYKIGESLGTSMGFMGEFVLTGGATTGVGKSLLKGAAKMGIESTAGKLGLNAVIKLAQTGIQTPLMPSLWQKTALDVSKGDSFGDAFVANLWQTAAETGSERIFMVNPVKGAGGAANAALRRAGINFNVDKGAVGVLRNTLEEYAEEKVGEIMTAPKDYDSFKEFWKGFTDAENNLTTFGSVALMTGGMGSVAIAGNSISKARYEARVAKVEKILPSDIRAEIDVIINNKDLTVQQQYGLVADIISERIDRGELEENPSEIAANAIAYLNYKTQQNSAEATDKSVVVENGEFTVKDIEEGDTKTQQEQLDYLVKQGVKVPDGTTAAQLKTLYDETKAKETQSGIKEDKTAEIVPERVEKEAAKKSDELEQKKADIERRRQEELKKYADRYNDEISKIKKKSGTKINEVEEWIDENGNIATPNYNLPINDTEKQTLYHESKGHKKRKVDVIYSKEQANTDIKASKDSYEYAISVTNAKYNAELVALEKVEQIKEKQDESNGKGNGISERTGYERTDETQMQGEGEQLQLGTEPNVKTEQKGTETAKTDTKDAEKEIVNTPQTEQTVKPKTEEKVTEKKTEMSETQQQPVINAKTKSETVKSETGKKLQFEIRQTGGGWAVDKKEFGSWTFVAKFSNKKDAQKYIDNKTTESEPTPISTVYTKATKALNLTGKQTTSMLGKTARNGKINGVDVVVQQGNTDNEIIIESMRTPSSFRQKGKATKALQQITEQADKDGITLKLRAVPQKGSKITEQQLKSFYEKNGFVFDGIDGVRKPNTTETPKELTKEDLYDQRVSYLPEGQTEPIVGDVMRFEKGKVLVKMDDNKSFYAKLNELTIVKKDKTAGQIVSKQSKSTEDGKEKRQGQGRQEVLTAQKESDITGDKSGNVTETEVQKITKTTSIKPKNLKDVYKAGREIFGLNRSQALAQAIIVNTVVNKIAKNRGVTAEKVWSEIEFVKGDTKGLQQGTKGAIQFLQDGQAIISALTNPNVSTPLHEIAHLYERYMPENERKAVLKWAKHKTWTVDTSEMFARGFEKYLAEGKAPTTELQKIFDRFKKWLTDIYNGITGSEIDIELNEAITNIYGQMLGVENVKPARAKKVTLKELEDGLDMLFQGGVTLLPNGVKKVKSFKIEEGKFSYYDTEFAPRGRAQYFTVLEDKKGWIVRNVLLPESERGKGIATQTYEYLNQESIRKTGNPLRSSRPRTIKQTGETITELSNDGVKLWERLVSKGLAIKTGDKLYEFIANPNILYQSPQDRTKQQIDHIKKMADTFKSQNPKATNKEVVDYVTGVFEKKGIRAANNVIEQSLKDYGYTPKFTEQYPIGTTNAKVRTSREMRGLDAIPKAERVANKDLWQSVVDKIANGIINPRQTVKDILSTAEVETSETKEAVVKWDRWRILKETKYTVEEIEAKQNANDNIGLVDLFMRKAELEVELQENDLAAEKLGATWGKAGQFRQRNLEEDMSLAAIIREAKILNGGKELTVKQEQRFKELSEKFEKLQAEYDKLRVQEQERQDKAKAEEEKKRKAAEQKLINDIQNNLVRQTPKAMRDFDTQFKADIRKQKLSEKENTIKERLKERLGRLANLQFAVGEEGSAMIVEELSGVIKDMSELGIVKLEQGIDRIISKVKDYMMSVDKKFDGKNLDKYKDEIKDKLGIEKVVDGEYERLITKLVEKSILGFDTSVKSILNDIVYNRVVSGRETIDDVVDDIYESVKDKIANIDKRKIRDAISGYGEFRKLSKEEADIKVRELKRQGRLDSAIEDVEDKNQLPLRTGVERDIQTQQTRQKQARILKEIKERDLVPPPTEDEQETQWRNGLQAYQRRLENAIEDIEKEIATGERKAKSQPKKYDSPELDILRTELERLKKVREAIDKETGKYVEQREQAIIKATERAIAELEMDIDKMRQGIPTNKTVTTKGKGIFGLSKAAKEKITSDKIEELRKLKEALQQQLSELMPDAIKDKALLEKYKRQRQRRLEQLLEQQRIKDYGERPKPYRPTLDKATIEINRKIERLKYDIEKEKEQIRLDNRTWKERLGESVLNAWNLPKALMASIDLSAPFRQGIVMISKPKLFGKAFKEMFVYAFSKNAYEDWLFDLKTTDAYYEMIENGLYIAEPTAKLSAKEENFMSNWLRYVDKIPLYGAFRAGSERAYIGFLNKLRIDVYLNFQQKLNKTELTKDEITEELKSYSHFINTATGRGKLSMKFGQKEVFTLEGVAPVLNSVFFSPRLIASRLAAFNPAFYSNMSSRTRKDAIKTYLGSAGIIMSTLMLSAIAFYDDDKFEIETDPRSADFMKIRYGNILYDLWGGHQQVARTLSQVITGQVKKDGKVQKMEGNKWYGQTRANVLTKFFSNKLSPSAALIKDILQGGKDYEGKDITITGELINKTMPLYLRDVKEAVQEEGWEFTFIAGFPALFGVGVQTYAKTKKEGTGNTEMDYIDQLPEEIPDMSWMEAIDGYEQTIPENPEWMNLE